MGQDFEQGKGRSQGLGPAWEQDTTHGNATDAGYASYEMTPEQREQLTKRVIKQIRGEFLGGPRNYSTGMMTTRDGTPSWRDVKEGKAPAQHMSSSDVAKNYRRMIEANQPKAPIPTQTTSGKELAHESALHEAAAPKGVFERMREETERKNIGAALDAITVHQSTTPTQLLDAGKIFALYPWNTEEKKKAFLPLKAAADEIRDAKTSKEKQAAEANFAAASRGVKDFLQGQVSRIVNDRRTMKRVREQLKQIGRQLAHAKKQKDANAIAQLQAGLVAKQQEEATIREPIEAEVKQKIEVLDCSLVPYTKTNYHITVDNEPVHLQDGVESYATTSLQGLDGKAVNESTGKKKGEVSTVKSKVDASIERTSVKKILKVISSSEGGFSTVNTYDKKLVTWGFVQWAGGHGSDLASTLGMMKSLGMNTFEKRFTKYGIDVVRVPEGWDITVRTPEGEVKQGEEAAAYVKSSPKLTAVLARAGMDPVVQQAEIRAAANGQIEKPLRQSVNLEHQGKKHSVRLEQIFTSEYGVGVLADRVVHGGLKKDDLEQKLQEWLNKKGYSPLNVKEWASAAERDLLPTVADGWTKRAKKFEGTCSKEPGSYR